MPHNTLDQEFVSEKFHSSIQTSTACLPPLHIFICFSFIFSLNNDDLKRDCFNRFGTYACSNIGHLSYFKAFFGKWSAYESDLRRKLKGTKYLILIPSPVRAAVWVVSLTLCCQSLLDWLPALFSINSIYLNSGCFSFGWNKREKNPKTRIFPSLTFSMQCSLLLNITLLFWLRVFYLVCIFENRMFLFKIW